MLIEGSDENTKHSTYLKCFLNDNNEMLLKLMYMIAMAFNE